MKYEAEGRGLPLIEECHRQAPRQSPRQHDVEKEVSS